MTDEDVMALFLGIRQEAFRLEQRDSYENVDTEDELFAAWRAGRSIHRTPATSPWLDLVAGHAAAGRRVYRVRIVDWPLSEYTRYELASYADNVAAGEEVYVVDRDAHPDHAALIEDFWLFDNDTATVMRYDDDGRPLDPAPGDARDHRDRRETALAHALPLVEWIAAHRQALEERALSA